MSEAPGHLDLDPFALDMASPAQVCAAFAAGARACLQNPHRAGPIEHLRVSAHDAAGGPVELLATGDLHDNPATFRWLCQQAGMVDDDQGRRAPLRHLTLHELIHGEHLTGGMDFSYRVLARAAALKARFPAHCHVLLANHELAQLRGHNVSKHGVHCVRAFADALDYVFAGEAPAVTEAMNAFIGALPLALRVSPPSETSAQKDLLCAHSLPSPDALADFDATVLQREAREDDHRPRTGSVHMLVWGRGHDEATVETLAKRLGIGHFVLGHERADEGVLRVASRATVLNTDHPRGRALLIDCTRPAHESVASARALAVPAPALDA